MTTRAFFDKGVYKTTLKRFSLGSILYFILLFLTSGMLFLLAYEPMTVRDAYTSRYYMEELMMMPVILSLIVPTVVSLLVYRFVNSKKASIFVHSLPVTRGANYVSTLLGAFTLMAVPVILNSIILMIISCSGYSGYFTVSDCVKCALVSLFALFVMFSVSTFATMCTGNNFAAVALNAILLFVPLLIATITETILLVFLYGYSYTRNLLFFAEDINPIYIISDLAMDVANFREVNVISVVLLAAFAIVLYILAFVLYKHRKSETSEEVAGFKLLNPIFKYTLTFIGTLGVFAIFTDFIDEKPLLFTFVVVLASVVFYFGIEMILKKTVRVWRAYKGYLVFGVCFAAFILFLGLTSVFGYETYVPDFEDIEEAAIYHYYYQSEVPFTKNEELNKYIVQVHQDFVANDNKPILNRGAYYGFSVYDSSNYDTRIHIEYKLKNGRTVTRRYDLTYDDLKRIMNEVYKYDEYKMACEAVFYDNIGKVLYFDINSLSFTDATGDLNELLECIRTDVLKLSYRDIKQDGTYCLITYEPLRNEKKAGPMVYRHREGYNGDAMSLESLDFAINEKYENTIRWFEEKGFEDIISLASRG